MVLAPLETVRIRSLKGDLALIKKHLAVILSVIILGAGLTFPLAINAQINDDSMRLEKTRASIAKLGTDRDQKVEIKLNDKTKVKGYITAVGADSFTLSDSKSGTGQTINYSEVFEARKSGGGISTKTWLILGGVAAGSVVTWIIVKPALCDGGAQTRGIC